MQDGDEFTVAPEHRAIGRVRNLANSRGSALGKRFSVRADPETGMIVVRCGYPPVREIGVVRAKVVKLRMRELYGVELDGIMWEQLDPGQIESVASEAQGFVDGKPFMAQIGMFNYALWFEPEGFSYMRLANGVTKADWERSRQMLAD
jgi:hypothetical protein